MKTPICENASLATVKFHQLPTPAKFRVRRLESRGKFAGSGKLKYKFHIGTDGTRDPEQTIIYTSCEFAARRGVHGVQVRQLECVFV